jgi:hypothetical protein
MLAPQPERQLILRTQIMSDLDTSDTPPPPRAWHRRRWPWALIGVAAGLSLFAWMEFSRPRSPETTHEVIVVETFDEDGTRGLLGRRIDGAYMGSQFISAEFVEWYPKPTNENEVAVTARYSTGPHVLRFEATEVVKLDPANRVCRVHIHVAERDVRISQCLPAAANLNRIDNPLKP